MDGLAWVLGSLSLIPSAGDVPKPGEPAPDFSLPDQDGRTVTRDSLRGRRVVLAFYPKDFTPG
jgi:peroxiredoxin Q/BCP